MSSGNVHLTQKCSRNIIARPLATLINLSRQKGHFPSKLKYAKIIPVYKDGDESEPCNYRPIPLVPIFNRIFKKIVYNRLTYFFLTKALCAILTTWTSLPVPYLCIFDVCSCRLRPSCSIPCRKKISCSKEEFVLQRSSSSHELCQIPNSCYNIFDIIHFI